MAKVKQHWVKTTPFGDYRMTEDRVNARKNRDIHIIRKARALGLIGKHAGSKPLGRLVQSIRTYEIGVKLYEDYRKAVA